MCWSACSATYLMLALSASRSPVTSSSCFLNLASRFAVVLEICTALSVSIADSSVRHESACDEASEARASAAASLHAVCVWAVSAEASAVFRG